MTHRTGQEASSCPLSCQPCLLPGPSPFPAPPLPRPSQDPPPAPASAHQLLFPHPEPYSSHQTRCHQNHGKDAAPKPLALKRTWDQRLMSPHLGRSREGAHPGCTPHVRPSCGPGGFLFPALGRLAAATSMFLLPAFLCHVCTGVSEAPAGWTRGSSSPQPAALSCSQTPGREIHSKRQRGWKHLKPPDRRGVLLPGTSFSRHEETPTHSSSPRSSVPFCATFPTPAAVNLFLSPLSLNHILLPQLQHLAGSCIFRNGLLLLLGLFSNNY